MCSKVNTRKGVDAIVISDPEGRAYNLNRRLYATAYPFLLAVPSNGANEINAMEDTRLSSQKLQSPQAEQYAGARKN